MAAPIRTAFVMEQALGHTTHYRNLREFTDGQRDFAPTWLPIPFDASGVTGLVPGLRSNWSLRASWRARRALASTVGQLDALVFHTQVTSLFSTALMRQLPTVISLDATPINYDTVGHYYDHKPASDSLLDRQKYRMNRSAFHAADGLVTWSDWARRSLETDYGVDADRIRVLAPGASPLYFELGGMRAARIDDDAQPRRVRLLFVGADFRRKGGHELLECLKGPLGELCELHVVTRDELPAMPGVTVHRGLKANSPELLQLFADADAFVLPSHAECLAVVLMEASAAGLPLITTDVAALSEAVQPGKSGLLIPRGDGRALSEAISTLVRDRSLRLRMGRASYALACEKFHAERNNRALLDYVKELKQRREYAGSYAA